MYVPNSSFNSLKNDYGYCNHDRKRTRDDRDSSNRSTSSHSSARKYSHSSDSRREEIDQVWNQYHSDRRDRAPKRSDRKHYGDSVSSEKYRTHDRNFINESFFQNTQPISSNKNIKCKRITEVNLKRNNYKQNFNNITKILYYLENMRQNFDQSLFHNLREVVLDGICEYCPKDLSMLANAFAKLNTPLPTDLLEAISRESQNQINQFNP